MEGFLTTPLRRHAIYEIAVASLRGINNLTSQKNRIEEYFSTIDGLSEIADIEDATTLLIYCSAAHRLQHFQIDENKLVLWQITLLNRMRSIT